MFAKNSKNSLATSAGSVVIFFCLFSVMFGVVGRLFVKMDFATLQTNVGFFKMSVSFFSFSQASFLFFIIVCHRMA